MVTIKPENAGIRYRLLQKNQCSPAKQCGQWGDGDPSSLGTEVCEFPAGETRLSRTDYGLRPFLMVAQKRQKLLQQNCPSSRS